MELISKSIYIYTATVSGRFVEKPFEIHYTCSYSQTQLSIMSLIKSTHLATGFDQT